MTGATPSPSATSCQTTRPIKTPIGIPMTSPTTAIVRHRRRNSSRASIRMVKDWLAGVPDGPVFAPVPQVSEPHEGVAVRRA